MSSTGASDESSVRVICGPTGAGKSALAIELVLLGLVAVGLALTGPLWLGIAYGAVALVSGLVNYAFKP